MAAAVQQRQGDDIDRFIKDQRQKIQQERRTVNDVYSETDRGRRRQWDRSSNNQYAEEIDNKEDENENAFSKRCPSPEISLRLGQYEKVRLRLNAERQQEYNDLQKKAPNVGKKNLQQSPRDLYDYDVVKREMNENKRQAYLDYLQKGQPGAPSGRLTWDQTGQTQLPAQQGNRGKKHTVNFGEWEKGFQDDKRKDYNKYLKIKQNQGRVLKKEPTPPLEGMKFGEYEEFKREMEPDRRRQYKEDLEKQKREQALIKMKRDYPNKLPLTNISPRRAEVTDRKEYQSQIDERKQKQFSKMLAQQPAVRDVRPQNTQPRRRSPSPEFSDPGMQLQADRIRARIRDLPTRPEEVEELQRRQQQQDALKRELDDFSPRNSYEERRPPVDLSPRLDDYGPGFSDRYPPPQEDYRQQPQGQGSRPQPHFEDKNQNRPEPQTYDEDVRRHVEHQRHLKEEAKRRREVELENDENIRKQLEIVKRRQELEEKRRIKEKLEKDTRRQMEEERQRDAERRKEEQEAKKLIAARRQLEEEEKKLRERKHQESVKRQIEDKNRQEAEEKRRLKQEQQQDEGMFKLLEKGRQREAEEKRRKQEFEEEQYRQLEESKRLLEEGRPSTVHVRFDDYAEEAVPRRQRPSSEHIPGYGAHEERQLEQRRRTKTTEEHRKDKIVVEEGVSLPISSHKQRKKKLMEERNQEYNAILAQDNKKDRTKQEYSGEGLSLRVSDSGHKQRKKQLEEERNKEYNELVAQDTKQARKKPETFGERVSLGISDSGHKQRRKLLEQERNREYNEIVVKNLKQASKETDLSGEGASLRISDSGHKQRKKHLEEERNKEYNAMVTQGMKQANKKTSLSGEGVSLRISDSGHKQRKKQLEEERNKEYNEMVDQLKLQSKKKDGDDLVGEGISLPLSDRESQRQQLKEAVKKEYNEMLVQQGNNTLDKDKSILQGEAISLPLSAHEEKCRQMIKERQEQYKDLLAQFKRQPNKRSNIEGEDKGLSFNDHTDQHKNLPQESTGNSIETITKKNSEKSGRNPLEGEAISLPISGHEKERRRLMEERRREYNEMIGQLKSKNPNRKGTESTFVPGELDTRDNKVMSDPKQRDFTQQYDSEHQGRGTTAFEKKLQELYKTLEPDPYPRDLARPELLESLPQGQYEVERERVDFDRQRQNEEMLSKNDVVERMRFVNQLEENRIFLNRMYHPWRENPTRQTLKDAVPVHIVSTNNSGECNDNVTPDDNEVEQVEEEQKQNTGRRLKREKDEGRPITPGGLLNKLGVEQQQRSNKLNDERKKEYNQLLTEQAEAILDMTKSYAEAYETTRSERGGKPRRPSSEKGTRYTEDPRPVRGRPPRPDYNSTPPRTQARFEDSGPESFSGGLPGQSAAQNEQDQLNLSFDSPRSWSMEWFERPKDYNDVKPYSMRKRVERNDEYNEFLRNKENERSKSADRRPPLPRERERPVSRHGRNSPSNEEVPRLDLEGRSQPPRPTPRRKQKQQEKFEASLPGLKTNSAQKRRKEEERNREYNEMLKKQKGRGRGRGTPRDAPPETRRGWQTPTYDEILEKKRREERQYRRQEDPYGDNRGMRPYASEGAINRIGIDDVKMRDLDRDYEQRRVRFQNDRAKERGILDDDNWLRTDAAKEQEYSKLVKKISGPERKEPQEPPNPRRKDMSRPPGDFFATLPLGQGERDSANKRRKLKYRDELHLQMREKVASKEREKREGLLVSATGHLDPEKKPVRVKPLGPPEVSPRRRIRSPEVKPYHINIVQQRQAPRGGGYDPSGDFGLGGGVSFGAESSAPRGRRRDQGGYEPSAFLDGGGFDTSLLETRKPKGLSLPPGLQYQPTFGDLDPDTGVPSTYITGQDIGGINSQNSIDDAYRFYGMRNPLDPEPSGGGSTTVPPLNLGGEGQGFRGRSSPRVTFDESHRGILKDSARRTPRHRSPGRTTPYQFDADQEDRDTKNFNKREYANELARQMELDKLKKERQKQENQLYEKKIEEDMLNYNPFGRSGGGAPNVDSRGQPIADLRQMKRRVDDPSYTPPPRESPRFRAPVSPKDDLIPPPPAQINAEGESTYALGGHGIFGNPRTEEEKSKADKYKDDLRLQILEKKRQDQLKKEQEKIEEEKENRRLEEQRQRIQRDFDEEQRKKREKEEENRRKQEELIRKNEEKRREAERAKREKAEIRQRDRERELDEQKRFESQQRTSSPPVPSLRSKLATVDGEPEQENNIPTLEVPPSHPHSRPISREESQTSNGFHPHYRAESAYFSPKPPPGAKRPSVAKSGDGGDARTDSPPVPAQRTQQEPQPKPKARPPPEPLQRANSSEVLRELANMRQQLESERKRVEGALNKQKNEPEVFDPRLVQRPPPKEVDVFERATQGNASVPQRVSDNANPKNIQEFQDLKYKAPEDPAAPIAPTSEASAGDTESRRAFRSMFPEQPYTNTTLESQQDAMLRQQNEQIRTLKDRSYVPPNDLGMSARQGTGTPRSLLQANTAFIDVENVNHFPEDFDDMPKRNDSARLRRRERVTPLHDLAGPSNVMGSVSSLDVDGLQRKNDARIRRLQQINADEVSMTDPDEILENFMAKQRYNRPPSGQTLQDDTWLQPGNKQL